MTGDGTRSLGFMLNRPRVGITRSGVSASSSPVRFLIRNTKAQTSMSRRVVAGLLIIALLSFTPSPLSIANSFMTPAAIAQSVPQSVLGLLRSSQPHYPAQALNITRVYSSSPAPVGIADYGVESVGGHIRAYKLALSSVTGTALLNSVSSSHGESLQLNVVMRVNTTSTSYVYWLQNVFSPPPASFFYPELISSIWNWTAPSANLDSTRVFGIHGGVAPGCVGSGCVGPNPTFYYGGERFSNYSLPLGLRLRINVSYSGSRVNVDFFNATAEGGVPTSTKSSLFDSVAISEPSLVTGAAILVDGYEMTPGIQLGRLTYYDAEFVFGGWLNLETTTFTSMDSTIAMSYKLENKSVIAPLSLYEFGETGEKVTNLAVTPTDQLHGFQFHVGLGRTNFSANYVRQPQNLNPLNVSYSFPGGPPTGMTALLDYVNNGTETFTNLDVNQTTFRADAGSAWQIITNGLPSNSTVRWAPSQANGTVSGPQTIHAAYHRQFLVHLGFVVNGGGTGYSNPVVTFGQFGLTASAQAGSSVWADAGTSYSFPSLLRGSASSERWISNDTSGAVSSPGEIQAYYQHQYGVTIGATADGSLSYVIGSTRGTISPGTTQMFYVQPGTEISLIATPTSFWYEFVGWGRAGGGTGSQVQEIVNSPVSLEGEFSINGVNIIGILVISGGFLALGVFLLERRFRSPVRKQLRFEDRPKMISAKHNAQPDQLHAVIQARVRIHRARWPPTTVALLAESA